MSKQTTHKKDRTISIIPVATSPLEFRKEAIIASIVIVLAVLIPYWRLVLMQGYIITDDIFTSDLMNDAFPLRFALGELLKNGEWPLWLRESYGGFPLLARSEAGVCFPPNLILFGLLPPYIALNIIILLTLIVAGIAMYWYLKEIDVRFSARLLGAIAFSYCGYMVAHIKHLSNVNAACLLPFGFFFIERAVRRKQPMMFFGPGLIFGLQHLAGHTQAAYYSGLAYIFYAVARIWHEYSANPVKTGDSVGGRGKERAKLLLRSSSFWIFIGAMALGSTLAAVQLLPTYELVSLSQRAGGVGFEYAANYAYDPKNLLMFFYPYINGDIGNSSYTGTSIFWEDYGYVGIAVLALALFGIARMRQSFHARFFLVAAVISLILVLGPATPVFKAVFHLVPGMSFFRFPTRFLLIVDFSLIVLAAIGFSHLVSRLTERKAKALGNPKETKPGWIQNRLEIAVLALVFADLCYFQLRQNPIVDGTTWKKPPEAANYLVADSSLFRIYSLGGNESHKIAFSRAKGWQGDLQPYIDQREFLQPTSNVLYGIASPDGYQNFTPNYLVDVWGDQNRGGILFSMASLQESGFIPTQAFHRLMDLANVKYLISLWPVLHGGKLEEIGRKGEAFLYQNPTVIPRAYLVNRTRSVRNAEDGKRMLLSEEFDPRHEAFVMGTKSPIISKDTLLGTVTVEAYKPNEVILQVSSFDTALLVLSDTYYPGWKVYVNEKESDIIQTNLIYRGVVIGSGQHKVRFVFEPTSVRVGFWISVVSLVAFGTVGIVGITRRRRSA